MRKLLLLLLIAPLFALGQKHKGVQRQAFQLPRIDGKITYLGRASIKYNNFERSVKMALGQYVSYYNALIEQESNKMRDYIVYEDTSVIVANVRFYVRQAMRLSIFSAEVTYQKLSPDKYGIKATGFKFDKMAQAYIGQLNTGNSIDNVDEARAPKLYGMMQNEVEKLFNYSFNN